jgi:hypothetical protein
VTFVPLARDGGSSVQKLLDADLLYDYTGIFYTPSSLFGAFPLNLFSFISVFPMEDNLAVSWSQ